MESMKTVTTALTSAEVALSFNRMRLAPQEPLHSFRFHISTSDRVVRFLYRQGFFTYTLIMHKYADIRTFTFHLTWLPATMLRKRAQPPTRQPVSRVPSHAQSQSSRSCLPQNEHMGCRSPYAFRPQTRMR